MTSAILLGIGVGLLAVGAFVGLLYATGVLPAQLVLITLCIGTLAVIGGAVFGAIMGSRRSY
jgi:hypothetical protein